ncbi:unnamed protein product [Cylicostephanus goldi]|uniref:Uncharacterized protein n=1 Tax=Cylicostephanus goldi TaxID=71465 RepID=A0A3P6TZ15_CYLGO|nr:unnamed protein product [Cylicostephanus goldi]
MATRKMNFFEKMANMLGCIYRHQAAQFPRRWAILKAVGKHELAPPKATDWPVIKAEWKKVTQFISKGQYKELTVRVGQLLCSHVSSTFTKSFYIIL